MKIFKIVLLAALIAAAVWLWTIVFPSPERVIRHHLAALAGDVSFQPHENAFFLAARSKNAAGFFTTNCEIIIDVPGRVERTLRRDEIARDLVAAHSEVAALTVQFLDVNVVLDAGKQSAVADLTVRARVPGWKDDAVQEMRFTFQKIGGRWLITRAAPLRSLS
ncbi:MAG: hypothetical protein KGJ88_11270 [Verrucomicrobiota bacterium]|nr:hypothetical protein [Verrucomicrobiota bacterium]